MKLKSINPLCYDRKENAYYAFAFDFDGNMIQIKWQVDENGGPDDSNCTIFFHHEEITQAEITEIIAEYKRRMATIQQLQQQIKILANEGFSMQTQNLFNPTNYSTRIIKNDTNLSRNLVSEINALIYQKKELVAIDVKESMTIIKFKKD